MNPINDDGERYSIQPYLKAISQLSRVVSPAHLNSLSGSLYRGVMLKGSPVSLSPGIITTARKRVQSWSPSHSIAKEFATAYDGDYGLIFYSNVNMLSNQFLLSIRDAYDYLMRIIKCIGGDFNDLKYGLEMYTHQDEVLVQGTKVPVEKIELFCRDRPGVLRSVDQKIIKPLRPLRPH